MALERSGSGVRTLEGGVDTELQGGSSSAFFYKYLRWDLASWGRKRPESTLSTQGPLGSGHYDLIVCLLFVKKPRVSGWAELLLQSLTCSAKPQFRFARTAANLWGRDWNLGCPVTAEVIEVCWRRDVESRPAAGLRGQTAAFAHQAALPEHWPDVTCPGNFNSF